MAGTNVTVTDLAPAYVDTELDVMHKERMIEMLGGKPSGPCWRSSMLMGSRGKEL